MNEIIACDFDGTLCENAWPDIGAPNTRLIEELKRRRKTGEVRLILWTCRSGERLKEAVDWCGRHGLYFDAVNANVQEVIERFGEDCRKVFANLYIDDLSYNPKYMPLPPRTGKKLHRIVEVVDDV